MLIHCAIRLLACPGKQPSAQIIVRRTQFPPTIMVATPNAIPAVLIDGVMHGSTDQHCGSCVLLSEARLHSYGPLSLASRPYLKIRLRAILLDAPSGTTTLLWYLPRVPTCGVPRIPWWRSDSDKDGGPGGGPVQCSRPSRALPLLRGVDKHLVQNLKAYTTIAVK